MKKQKFSEAQILKALKEYESGKNVMDICRELGIHKATFYVWNKKYSGMKVKILKGSKSLKKRIED
jgi:putative transposase